MIWMAIVGLIWMACFGFYTVSEKQILKTRQSRYSFLVSYPVIVKLISGSLLLLVLSLLRTQFSSCISFMALWVFISPIVFIFILKMNNLKQTKA